MITPSLNITIQNGLGSVYSLHDFVMNGTWNTQSLIGADPQPSG
jgi:hypothetical protein